MYSGQHQRRSTDRRQSSRPYVRPDGRAVNSSGARELARISPAWWSIRRPHDALPSDAARNANLLRRESGALRREGGSVSDADVSVHLVRTPRGRPPRTVPYERGSRTARSTRCPTPKRINPLLVVGCRLTDETPLIR